MDMESQLADAVVDECRIIHVIASNVDIIVKRWLRPNAFLVADGLAEFA